MKNILNLIARISIITLIIFLPHCLDAKVGDGSFLILVDHNKDSLYKEIPKCPVPMYTYYSYVDKSTVLVFWDDLPAVKGELEYEVRYKSMSRGGWREKFIYEGQSILIEDLIPGLTYSFEIRKICYSETGAFKLEGEWVNIRTLPVRSSSVGINCDTLGEIEILPGDGFTTSFSVPSGIWSLVSDQDCYLIFQLVYCRIVYGSLRCVTIYWFYDGTQMNNFSLDIDQLDYRMNLDSTTTPYLQSAYVSMYCESDSGLPLGALYGSAG